jgi:hypothetical protein
MKGNEYPGCDYCQHALDRLPEERPWRHDKDHRAHCCATHNRWIYVARPVARIRRGDARRFDRDSLGAVIPATLRVQQVLVTGLGAGG